MPLIGAATRDDVHDTGACAAKLDRVIGVDDAEFQDRLLRRCTALDARSRRNVVGSIHRDEIVVNVLPREGELGHWLNDHVGVSRGGIPYGDGGREQCEVDELTTVHRKVHDLVFCNYRADLGSGGLRQFCSGFDFHFLNHFSRRESKAKLRGLPDLQRDVLLLFSKARKLNSDFVFSSG